MNLKVKNSCEKKKIKKGIRGITLIALVVTIIVLLVLAGVGIAMLSRQNGILNRASEAKEQTAVAQEDEDEKLQGYENIIRQYADNLPTGEGTTPYLPDATKFEKVAGTDLDSGLVIEEKATGSQYVWVEVPRTSEVYPTAGVDITNFTDDAYTKIENDLHTYTNDYRNGTDYSDVYCADSATGWFTDADEYDELKQKMLKSVYQNGGFWVGRYEAGIEDEANIRKAKTDSITLTPVTKQNMYPYNYVTRTQAKVLSGKVESGNCTSSLMFGVQWDLVLKYIETKNATTQSNLNNNSTTIGNYINNLWNITNTNAKYSKDSGINFTVCPNPYAKTLSSNILLTTGADESFSLMNIYDIAGNVWEWTLEKTTDDVSPCARRGGYSSNTGSEGPASSRNNYGTSYTYYSIGFRFSIY